MHALPTLIRRTHRWIAILFTLTVMANFAVRALGEPPAWITYSPLPPLALLLFSGLYLFVLPYTGKRPKVPTTPEHTAVASPPNARPAPCHPEC